MKDIEVNEISGTRPRAAIGSWSMIWRPVPRLVTRGCSGRAIRLAGQSLLLCACLASISVPCIAHHAGSLWDPSKKLTLHGTVKQFQWTNPHCFIQLWVEEDGGNEEHEAAGQEWSIEMASPFQVLTGGWKPATLKPGDKIEVTIHPARPGSRSGDFLSAVDAAGRPLQQTAPVR